MTERELVMMFGEERDNKQIGDTREKEIDDENDDRVDRHDLDELNLVEIGNDQDENEREILGPQIVVDLAERRVDNL